ncbi:hypothetical protein AX16_001707 [Volvariella volvacea WC 439]|nr:hypothetical protein AX16_001707 [Volvariella volvacea WC 439]
MFRFYSRLVPSIVSGTNAARAQSLNASPITSLLKRTAFVQKGAIGHAVDLRAFHSSPLSNTPEAAKSKTASKDAKPAAKAKTGTATKAKKTATTKAKKGPAKKKAEKPKRAVIKPEMRPPKRPPSAYFLFYLDFLEKNNLKPADKQDVVNFSIKSSQAWKELTLGEKQRYHDLCATKFAEYNASYDEWARNVDPAVLKELNRRKKARGGREFHLPKDGPSRPLSAYLMFAQETRSALPAGLTFAEAGRKLGENWKGLSEAEKEPYRQRSKEEHAKWVKAKEAASAQ